jgi:pimeloyl-ACP methyl ester carboxylesterase
VVLQLHDELLAHRSQGYDPNVGIEIGEDTLLVAASPADLPSAVADALATPDAGQRRTVVAAGLDWGATEWGDPADPPLLLVHGVTSEASIWWRLGPALAAARRRVTAVDLPGHGETAWTGRHRFRDTASDLTAFIDAAGLARPGLAVVAHSWGAMVSAHLPIAGMRPAVLVLIDPPYWTRDQLALLTQDPSERRYASLDEARQFVRRSNPTWSDGDVEAKAVALTRFDEQAVLTVLVENGDWDAGVAAIGDSVAVGVRIWYIRGEEATGGFIPDAKVAELTARVGADHVLTIVGGPHSPQRTHPEATTLAILRALEAG